MLVVAIIIYVIGFLASGFDPLWPIDLLGGKAGLIGQILVVVWIILLIAGLTAASPKNSFLYR